MALSVPQRFHLSEALKLALPTPVRK